MMQALRRAYLVFAYYLSWLLFGLVGLGLNIACMPLLFAPRRERFAPRVRTAIRVLFGLWVRWQHASMVVDVVFSGFDAPLSSGTIFVANHPTLVDATFLLSRLPEAICIFKPALMHNPAIGPAAVMAGYAVGDAGVDTIRAAAGEVAAGQSLLIFPEGTRTDPGEILRPLKGGFALIAARARAPVQLVVIRATRDLAARGMPWWRAPSRLPARVEFTLDRRWEFDPHLHAAALTAQVERRLRDALSSG
jgi:1-acyl-sn-glycerol-3-phosphate acyltransferase